MTAIKSFLKVILYKPLYNALIFFVWLIPGNNVGVAIIILTVLIRLILLPSSNKSIEAQRQLKEIQPEMDKIKEKYKDDKQAQAQATMALYQQYKINPLSSCLPLLIQLPILIILYYVFRVGLDTSRFDLLYSFMPRPETINAVFLGIDLTKPNIYLAIITGLLQFWQSWQIMPPKKKDPKKTQDSADRLQSIMGNQMLYVMPVFTVIIAMQLPAALPLYWAVTTLFGVIQQYYVFKKAKKNPGVQVQIHQR